jgi:hypothetical protein
LQKTPAKIKRDMVDEEGINCIKMMSEMKIGYSREEQRNNLPTCGNTLDEFEMMP